MEVPRTQEADPPPLHLMAGALLISRLQFWRAAPGAGQLATRAALAAELARRVLAVLPYGPPGLTAAQLRDLLFLPAGTHSDFTGRKVREALGSADVHQDCNNARPSRYWRILR